MSDEATPRRGLFEQDLIVEGKRIRKSVERLGSTPTPTAQRRKIIRQGGHGDALHTIEGVEQKVDETDVVQLKPLHKLMYGTVGPIAARKQQILEFNGFVFDSSSSTYQKKKVELEKMSNEELKLTREILGIREGNDETEMILQFLMDPKRSVTPSPPKRKATGKSSPPIEKRARTSVTPPGLQLSESSSDEEDQETSPSEPKQKKRVSFDLSVRFSDEPGLVAEQSNESGEEFSELPEDVLTTIKNIINSAEDASKITIGWLLGEIIRQHPEQSTNRGTIREQAIKELRAVMNNS